MSYSFLINCRSVLKLISSMYCVFSKLVEPFIIEMSLKSLLIMISSSKLVMGMLNFFMPPFTVCGLYPKLCLPTIDPDMLYCDSFFVSSPSPPIRELFTDLLSCSFFLRSASLLCKFSLYWHISFFISCFAICIRTYWSSMNYCILTSGLFWLCVPSENPLPPLPN